MYKGDSLENIYSETWEVLKNMNIEYVSKIPTNVLKTIRENKNNNWSFKYNIEKKLNEQNIMEETKDFLSIIYYKYCCSDEEKNKIIKFWKK